NVIKLKTRICLLFKYLTVATKSQSKLNRIALVINNIKFHDETLNLDGCEKDDGVMSRLLQNLGYQVVLYRNLTGQEIDDALTEFSKHIKLSYTDSVFVIIMSHGNIGIISGTDSKTFEIEKIFLRLNTKNCPALVNKPKIIIIDACRGGNSQLDQRIYLSDSLVHIEKDLICFHSSTPHTASYFLPTKGSFFIQTLSDVFNKWSYVCDIEELFRKVSLMTGRTDLAAHWSQLRLKKSLGSVTKRFSN
uniref:Caspase family p20 domain-containing protein n=1 Tax=Oreochromis niloticus TaxID=8128 RepID=A0A669AXG3_ORENI